MNQFAIEDADFFISRAGKNEADVAMSEKVAAILKAGGHRVVLQQWDFKNRNFFDCMDRALASRARVIAILSPEYLATDYCNSEWQHALRGDPLNRKARLIVLRAAECEPLGLLANIVYWDLVPLNGDDALLSDLVNLAVLPDAESRRLPPQYSHWRREPPPILHHEVHPTDNFTGRESALIEIDSALWSDDGAAAAITQPAAVTGLGGIGKSTLAREYAWQAREGFTGIWWFNASTTDGGSGADEIERGLVELGEHYQPGIADFPDRSRAARHVLGLLGEAGFAKPWLLIYDNVDDPKLLANWRPRGNVRTLVTTRLDKWGTTLNEVEIQQWPIEEATSYLLAESGRDDISENEARQIAEDLGGLPLALSHAAAYLRDNTFATAESYRAAILQHMSNAPADAPYDKAVFATFTAQMQQAEVRGEGATALLRHAAFYAPDDIPISLFQQEKQAYHLELANLVSNPVQLERALGALDKLSLIEADRAKRTFSVHRLVQAAARDALGDQRQLWASHAAAVALNSFPEPSPETRDSCVLLSRHATALAEQAPSGDLLAALGGTTGNAGTAMSHFISLADGLTLHSAANAIFGRLAASDPGNAGWQRDLFVSHIKIGDVLVEQGNLTAAVEAYNASLAIAERLAASDPGNAGWQRDLSVSQEKIGDVLVEQGNLTAAVEAYNASLAIAERLAASDPGNAGWQRDLSVSHIKIGDVLRAQGNLTAAVEAYNASLAIRERLAASDPGNAGWQRDLSVSHNNIGDVLRAQGNLTAAVEAYNAFLAIAERLAASDPGNAGWQRDLSVSQEKIGDVLRAQGNLTAAVEAYNASLAIAERLAASDPGNAGWQRDLSVSHNKIGDVLRAQGNLPAAVEAYKASLAIAERLAASDPGNAGWQRDLSVSQEKIGDVLVEQGNLPAAVEAYKASLAIRERLAASDPGNAGWQADVAASYGKFGQLQIALGNNDEARQLLTKGRALVAPLAESSGHATWQSYIKSFDALLASLNNT